MIGRDPIADDLFLRTLGRLTRGALHELSNPLLAVIGSAELALAAAEPGSKVHERLQLVHRTSLEIAEIVRALQGFTRERAAPPRPIPLGDAAAGAIRLVELVSAVRDVEVRLRRETEPVVVASPGDVAAALVSALLDAVTAAERDAVVQVVVTHAGGDAVVRVDGDDVLTVPLEEET
ncbi:MAG TPA: hypothetical protein VNT58_06945 [Gaiellaceae bacterium]|nr:hypothetical protein [Gaiellaceae bacterium]